MAHQGQHESKEPFVEANAGDGTTVFDQYLTGLPLYLCFASCFMTLFLIGLDITIVMTILETIGGKFDAYDKIGWVSSGFMLTMGVFAQTWGNLSLIFGRKYPLLIAIIIFECGSLMCALAPTMNILIGGRVLAGIGGGGIQTLVFIIGTEMVPINKRAFAFAFFGVSFSISTVVGPLIGGALTQKVSWRWCFYINLPIGGISFLAMWFLFKPPMPKYTWKEKFQKIDYVGTFLLTSGLVVFLLGLTFGGEEFAWDSGAVISCFIIGGVLLILFCIWNFKWSKNQIIPKHIVSVAAIDATLLAIFFGYYCFMGFSIYVTTYFQVVRGFDPLLTGIHFLPLIVSLVIASVSTGALVKITRHVKPIAVFGGVLGAVGFGLTTLLDVDSSMGAMIGLLILPGVSVGILLQTGMMASQLSAPKIAGATILTTAMFNFSRSIGGTIGGDLSQAIFDSSSKNSLGNAFVNNPELFEGMTKEQLLSVMTNPTQIETLPADTKRAILGCVMKAIHDVLYTVVALACISLVAILLYSNKRVPKLVKEKPDEEVKAGETEV